MDLKEARKLVKKANQRITTIIKQGLQHQSSIYQYIEKNSQSKIFSKNRSGDIKFRTDLGTLIKKNKELYNRVLEEVNKFLEAKTSTKLGIEEVNKKRYEKFKEKNKNNDYSNISFDMYKVLVEMKLFELYKKYGSDVVNEIISLIDFNEVDMKKLNDWIDEAIKSDWDANRLEEELKKQVLAQETNEFNDEEFEELERWWNQW